MQWVLRGVQATVDVEIEGVLVTVPVNFGPNAPALIGRQTMFAVLDKTGFTTTEWLLKWKPPPSPQQPPSPAGSGAQATRRIIDHGSWLDIGGVAVAKR